MKVAIDAAATIWQPERAVAVTAPLVLLLHGKGSNEQDLLGLTAQLPKDAEYASLRAPYPLATGWGWFRPAELSSWQRPAAEYVPGASAILRWADEFAPGRPLLPIGFSQGGAMSAQLIRMAPERVIGAGVLSGFVHGESEPGDDTDTQVFIGHGDADNVVPVAAAHAAHELFNRSDYIEISGMGHALAAAEITRLSVYIARVLRAHSTA